MVTKMALVTNRRWPIGHELQIAFLNGDDWQQGIVVSTAVEWGKYANIGFDFGAPPHDAEIRIAFEANSDSWSRLGTDALEDDSGQPTMQFGWITPNEPEENVQAVILHEFGHALACIHEHQNPLESIPWDKERVYAYYAGSPNYWTREEVDHNLFEAYDRDLTQFSAFDPASVMLYPIPEEHTIGDYAIGMNSTLSEGDKSFIGRNYPHNTVPQKLLLGESVAGSASPEEQEDEYILDVKESDEYEIETAGSTNVRIALYGPDNPGRQAGSDDDSGRDGYNARLRLLLMRGRYVLRVHHAKGGSGNYSVLVKRINR
jgi:hypothetical protein